MSTLVQTCSNWYQRYVVGVNDQMLHFSILFLPTVLSQFADGGIRPDVAFGDHNDRFDLTGVFDRQEKFHHVENEDYDARRSAMDYNPIANYVNRRSLIKPSKYVSRRSLIKPSKYRRDDDWLEDMADIADVRDNLDEFAPRAQEFRRRRRRPQPRFRASKKNKESRPHKRHRRRPKSHRRTIKKDEESAEKEIKLSPEEPAQREILLHYSLPVKIKVQDRDNSTFITGINIL